jgi:TetR/AcrR family transcriptional repressor of nem operon
MAVSCGLFEPFPTLLSLGRNFANKLDRWFLDKSLSPVARLRAFVDDARVGMARFDYRWGCLEGSPGQKIIALPNPFRNRLGTVSADWQERTALP